MLEYDFLITIPFFISHLVFLLNRESKNPLLPVTEAAGNVTKVVAASKFPHQRRGRSRSKTLGDLMEYNLDECVPPQRSYSKSHDLDDMDNISV